MWTQTVCVCPHMGKLKLVTSWCGRLSNRGNVRQRYKGWMNQPMYSVGVTLVRILEVTVHNGDHGPTVMMENMNVPHRLQCWCFQSNFFNIWYLTSGWMSQLEHIICWGFFCVCVCVCVCVSVQQQQLFKE